MIRKHLVSLTGLGLLAIAFVIAAGQILRRGLDDTARDGRRVIRFAHWQLESGLRESLDALAREYETTHPGVRVEQLAIPNRTYAQWFQTQLIGGTAPDIIQLPRSLDDETLARHFLPLSAQVEEPNPYNRDTPLALTPWRETFFDGMAGPFSYRPNLLQYYGVPLSMFTVRMYYNRDLWRRLLGDTPTPATYEDFLQACERIRARSAAEGRPLLPIVGSHDNGPILISKLVGSQTQKLALAIDLERNLKPAATDIALAALRDEWSPLTPAFDDALHLAREVSLVLQPGYEQLRHEDAAFYFIQTRAVMVTSGSWDLPGFRSLAGFEIGVFDVPLPDKSHPRYGRNLLGKASEAESSTGMAFGVARQTGQQDLAIDFLRFLTSQRGNAAFARTSGWLPSVVGVQPPPDIAAFLPLLDGYPPGFDFTLGGIGGSTARHLSVNMHLLTEPSGSVERFRDALAAGLKPALRQDLARHTRDILRNLSRQDLLHASYLALRASDAAPPARDHALDELLEAQNQQEARRAWITHELARTAR